MSVTYYICNECCQEVAGPDSICHCQEIKALKEEVEVLRTRAESAERERDELRLVLLWRMEDLRLKAPSLNGADWGNAEG